MHLSENIVLRPRFQFQVSATKDELLAAFQNAKKSQKAYILSIVDDHIFIKIPKQKQHFWSPQLHLELRTNEDSGLMLHGLFGPNPTVWTLFMFL
ncbi:MAG: GTP-binding protein, partial [Flavobacteriaceae bacterium]|nr:GTP-binding protein [Flavobacteriaceae bacterium]